MRNDNLGKKLVWMASGAAAMAAGVFLGAAAGQSKRRASVAANSPEREPVVDLADRPVAAAALADSLLSGRRMEQLSNTVAGVERRLQAMERELAAGRIEAVGQKVVYLEERVGQLQAEHTRIPSLEAVLAHTENRLSPRITGLESRLDEHQAAIRGLQSQAVQTEANLQKIITAVEKLAEQVSRVSPHAPQQTETLRPRDADGQRVA